MALSYPYIFLLALSLAMDAFAVSISAGISMQKRDFSEALKIALAFGIFQAVMPIIGFFGASSFMIYLPCRSLDSFFFLPSSAENDFEAVKKKGECEFSGKCKFLHLMVGSCKASTLLPQVSRGSAVRLYPCPDDGFVYLFFHFQGYIRVKLA